MRRRISRHGKSRRIRHAPPGTAPGTVIVPEDALRLKVRAIRYNETELDEKEVTTVQEIKARMDASPGHNHWIHIQGFGDKVFFEQLADSFGIHRLQMEDVMNTYQRPKAEEFQNHIFLVSRIVTDTGMGLSNDQLSLFL